MLTSDTIIDVTMSSVPDTTPRLPESVICEIAGVKRTRRRTWVQQNLVTGRGSGKYSELDALELTLFERLIAITDFEDAATAWIELRKALPDTAMGPDLYLVCDLQEKSCQIASSTLQIGDLVASGAGRPFRAQRVLDQVNSTRRAFANVVRARTQRGLG